METWAQLTGGHLLELDRDECWTLLATRHVGRVAWCHGGEPALVPVNFAVHDDAVWIRTTPYSELGREGSGTPVVFEVDEIDDFTQSGWSVVIRGTVLQVAPDALPASLPDVTAWPDGVRSRYLSIGAVVVSGRRLLAS